MCHLIASVDMGSFCAKGTMPILRQQRDWVGEVRQMVIFSDVQLFSTNYADVRWEGGSKKSKKVLT